MAQVSWKKPLALALTLTALGSAVYWLEFSHMPKKEEEEEQQKKLFRLEDRQISSFRLQDGKDVVMFDCQNRSQKLCKPGSNASWQLVEPRTLNADDSNVNSLVSSLNNLTVNETINLTDESDEKRAELLKQYGLDPQSIQDRKTRRIDIQFDDQTMQTVNFGEKHPITDATFAIGDQPSKVYLVPNYFLTNFDHDLTYWRDKKLFNLASHQVQAFELSGSQGRIQGGKKDGQWVLESGKQEATGDIENVDSLLASATNLNAKSFVSDDKSNAEAKRALAGTKQVLTLKLLGEDKEKPSVLVLHRKGGKENAPLYATVSTMDPLFELDGGASARLDKSLKDLRLTKLITTMERFGAKRLEFSGAQIGEDPVVLTQKDGEWKAEQLQGELNPTRVQDLLDKLSGNRIRDFIAPAKAPKEESPLRVALGDEKEPKKRELLFWKKGDKLFGRDLQSKRNEVFLVDSAVADALPWARDALVKTKADEAAERADEALKKSAQENAAHGEHDDHGHGDHGHEH